MRPPFINLWDIAGVLLVALPLVTLCWLVGFVQLIHVLLVTVLLIAAFWGIRKG